MAVTGKRGIVWGVVLLAAALSAGLFVTVATFSRVPVSTSQAIVGAIVGWNLFTGVPTDFDSLLRIG